MKEDEPRPLPPSPTCAEKIAKIAGIGPGDRVLCLGSAAKTVEAAVARAGAGLVTAGGRAGIRSLIFQARADVVLWAMDLQRRPEDAGHLRVVRRHLRAGGRLVAWVVKESDRAACVNASGLQELFRSAGFSSIIAGRVSVDSGDVVVATGIKAYAKIRKSGHDHRRKGN
jgi:hypothetical protein